MVIEQKPELNRFVDPSIPLTWQWRWRQFKITLPIWLFSLACLSELWLFHAWLSKNWRLDRPLILLGGWLAIILLVLGLGESQVRIRQRSKRVIEFRDGKIRVKPSKSEFIRWNKVAKFQFEPIPEMSGSTKLKLFLFGRSNETSERAFWATVLDNSQTQELACYLRAKKLEAPSSYEIQILEHPAIPESSAPFPFLGISLYMSGLFLLLHGGPALLVLLNHSHSDSDGDSKLSSEEKAHLGRFIAQHFSSKEEFRHFFLILNLCLIIAGIILLILGWRLMKHKTTIAPASKGF